MKGLIRYLVGIKNRQIRDERQRSRALEESCRILSAYIALIAESRGEIRVSAKEVGRAIGHCDVQVSRQGGDYVIKVARSGNVAAPFTCECDGFEDEAANGNISVSFADEQTDGKAGGDNVG